MDLIIEVALMIITWTVGLALLGVALTVLIAGTSAHSERKRNWRKGTHDYYGNELPKDVKKLADSNG